jgi:hypothetical protein
MAQTLAAGCLLPVLVLAVQYLVVVAVLVSLVAAQELTAVATAQSGHRQRLHQPAQQTLVVVVVVVLIGAAVLLR